MSLKVFETEKDLEEEHAGANDENSFLKNVSQADLLGGHSATAGWPQQLGKEVEVTMLTILQNSTFHLSPQYDVQTI